MCISKRSEHKRTVIHPKHYFFDTKILTSVIPENDCFALGVVGLGENNSDEGIKNTYLSLSMGYQKCLDEEGKQQLGIGFQATYARKKLIKPNFVFEDQIFSWASSGYTNIDIYNLNNVDVSYLDINAGIAYQGIINSKNSFSAGISMYHINEPNRIFQGGELLISRQIWGHIAWETNISNAQKLYSAKVISVSNKSITDLLAGVSYQISINKYNNFILGAGTEKTWLEAILLSLLLV